MGNLFAPPTRPPPPPPPQTVTYYPLYNPRPENVRVGDVSYCLYRTREACLRGNSCRFLHAGNIEASVRRRESAVRQPPTVLAQPNIQPRPDTQPRANTFNTPLQPEIVPRPNHIQPRPNLRPQANAQPRRPCRFFASGHCNKGAACRFSHDANNTLGAETQGQRTHGEFNRVYTIM